MGLLKRGEVGQHKLPVKVGKVCSSTSHCHYFILTSCNTKHGETLEKDFIR